MELKYVFDAMVLIDYCESDISVLKLFTDKIEKIFVPTPILKEVRELDESKCADCGLLLLEPDTEQVIGAAELSRRGGLSVEYWICLFLAGEKNCEIITNDRKLRSECMRKKIIVHWGLVPLIMLVENANIEKEYAIRVAEKIRINNPFFITEIVITKFMKNLEAL